MPTKRMKKKPARFENSEDAGDGKFLVTSRLSVELLHGVHAFIYCRPW